MGISCLRKRRWVETVLARHLETNVVAAVGVPGRLRACLHLRVDLVVVRRGEDTQIVGGRDGCGIFGHGIADGSRVSGDRSLLHIVPSFRAYEETLVSQDSVDVGGWALQEVEEGTGLEVGLLEVQVELGSFGLRTREELREKLGFQALGELIVQLDLSIKGIGGSP